MAGYSLQRLNVLVVDDNRFMLTLLRRILVGLGVVNVMEATDGAEAFQVMRTCPADIIFTDWMMSPVDGVEFTRLIRTAKDSPNRFVPIIMMTGHTEFARVIEARDAGVTEFLAKPVSAKSVYTRIVSVIEHPRPFIETKNYFGPDRRRRHDPSYTGPERRRSASGLALEEDQVRAYLDTHNQFSGSRNPGY